MNKFWAGMLGVLAAMPLGAAVSNEVVAATNTVAIDPVEAEYQQLMEADDEAQTEVSQWLRENEQFAAQGAGTPAAQMKQRIRDRLASVRKRYEDFLQRHPRHARARVAYGSFLGDVEGEEAAQAQYEQALALDTNNPAIYNNLANIHGHIGSVKKAFEYYTKAIQLNPLEPVYYHNFGTTVFLFRTDAREYFHLDEERVFAKAFALYSNALRLDPENFPLAQDIAQSYYGIQPLQTDTALQAWTNALRIAHDSLEREGVFLHLARVKLLAGRFAEARAHLAAVTNANYAELKSRLMRNLTEKEQGTNASSAWMSAEPKLKRE